MHRQNTSKETSEWGFCWKCRPWVTSSYFNIKHYLYMMPPWICHVHMLRGESYRQFLLMYRLVRSPEFLIWSIHSCLDCNKYVKHNAEPPKCPTLKETKKTQRTRQVSSVSLEQWKWHHADQQETKRFVHLSPTRETPQPCQSAAANPPLSVHRRAEVKE